MSCAIAVVDLLRRGLLILSLRVVVVYVRFEELLNEVQKVVNGAGLVLARLHAYKIVQAVWIG